MQLRVLRVFALMQLQLALNCRAPVRANWQAKLHSCMLEAHGVYSKNHVYSSEERQFSQRENLHIIKFV